MAAVDCIKSTGIMHIMIYAFCAVDLSCIPTERHIFTDAIMAFEHDCSCLKTNMSRKLMLYIYIKIICDLGHTINI